MNFKQINPNAQTLGQMVSKANFVYWFMSLNNDTISTQALGDTPSDYSFYGNGTIANNGGLYANFPALCDITNYTIPLIDNTNPQATSFNVNTQMVNLLGTIYDLFKNAIPYDQTTTSQQLITFAPRLAGNSYTANFTTANIPNVLNEISAYMGLYVNHIIQYVIMGYKYFVEGNILSAGLTNQRSENENEGNAGQNSGYSGNTFNPVNTSFTPTVAPMPINTSLNTPNKSVNQLPQGNASKLSSDTPASNPQGISFTSLNNLANANVRSNGFTNNKTLNRTYSYLNINELSNIANSQTLTVLKPLIYKISTLFWTLGNDYYSDEETWGFNIW